MAPQRRRQPKLTPVAAAVAAVDERRLQRLQASQRPRATDDETEVIPTTPLPPHPHRRLPKVSYSR
jgi:hypothetical protein